MHIHFDPDEWESTHEHRPCTTCRGDLRKCNGACNGMSSFGMKRRPMAEVRKIKEERRVREENEILARAEAIKALRRIQ